MAADMFLKVGSIEGETKDSKHKGWIEIDSWSWGETQSGSAARGGGAGVGKVAMSDFSFTKTLDKASPKLLLACAKGEHIPTAEFVARKAGGDQQPYLKMKLTDVLVSSYQTGASSELPQESISLNFSKIEWEYLAQDEKGATKSAGKAWWSVKENKGGS
jgi:type VI secretion system secreted protein Hcp